MEIHRNREDLSRFLVHLTRDYDGTCARLNLVNILKEKKIYARNAHCLVKHKIEEKERNFTPTLKRQFNTVCFTETPLTQIKQIATEIEGRSIQLEPYGIVFWKDVLFEAGSSPAIYINAKGTSVSKYLLRQFDETFKGVKSFQTLRNTKVKDYKNIVHFYSLINVVKDKHDFLWEREWRHHGDFTFEYEDIIAIIAKTPGGFEQLCKRRLGNVKYQDIKKILIIDPKWTYEELLERLAIRIWNKLS